MITTVLGLIPAGELGHVLGHEHLISSSPGLSDSFPEIVDRRATIANAVSRLREARAVGVRTVVDLAPFDLGRDVRTLAIIARRARVNVICASGVWRAPPRDFGRLDPDRLASLFIRELEVGIDGTSIRAGILKVATDERGIDAERERLMRAVARAHLRTGVPISTHAHAASRAGLDQLRVLVDEGVDPSRVCIGHSDDAADVAYVREILDRGAWVGLDHLAYAPEGTPSHEERIGLIVELLADDPAARLLVGHDYNATVRSVGGVDAEMARMNPDGYVYFHRRVRPKLLAEGISDAAIDALTLAHPAVFLEPARLSSKPIV